LISIYQGLEEENLDQKSPGPPGWGMMHQTSPLLITKKTRNAKKIAKRQASGIHTINT